MTGFEEKLLGGVAALLIILIVGTIFGRLHGSTGKGFRPLGDRVACGLFALPLISVAVFLAFPGINIVWILLAPLPLAIYVFLLAGTDLGWKITLKHFTSALFLLVMLVYLIMVAILLFNKG